MTWTVKKKKKAWMFNADVGIRVTGYLKIDTWPDYFLCFQFHPLT